MNPKGVPEGALDEEFEGGTRCRTVAMGRGEMTRSDGWEAVKRDDGGLEIGQAEMAVVLWTDGVVWKRRAWGLKHWVWRREIGDRAGR